jgi:hypothetical protein
LKSTKYNQHLFYSSLATDKRPKLHIHGSLSTQVGAMMATRIALSSTLMLAAVEHSSSSSSSRHLFSSDRSLQSSNAAITEDQYQTCLTDMLAADLNGNYELDASEFIRFATFNSAQYGFSWGYAVGQSSLDLMPLEFPMLFYTQACLCALEEASGCCSAENAHVKIYAGPMYASGITEKQDVYMREFCTEVYHTYSVTVAPNPMPSPMPMTMTMTPTLSPVKATAPSTPMPSSISTTPPTTSGPIAPNSTTPPTSSEPITPNSTTPPTTSEPITPNTTEPPTPTPTASQPTTLQPTLAGDSPPVPIIPITVQYGISSDCGVTAYDVMTANGNTIKDGLEAATETIVIEILNTTTWPWEESGGSGALEDYGSSSPVRVANLPTKVSLEKNMAVASKRSESGDEVVELPHLIRYNELVPVRKSSIDDVGKGVTYMLLNHQQPRRQRMLQQQQLSRRASSRRNLVYYTSNNVVITDVEDSNNDQACPPGLNCMIVSSVISVTLEPGDVPDIVGPVIEEGLQDSYKDGSFFESIPGDTVLCPLGPSKMPSSIGSIMPTPSNVQSKMPSPIGGNETNAPTAISSSVSSGGTSVVPTPSTTGGGNETVAPSGTPSTFVNGTAAPSPISSSNENITPTAMPSVSSNGTTAPSAPSTSNSTGGIEPMAPSRMPSPVSNGTATPSASALPGSAPSMKPTPASTGDETPAPSSNSSSISLPPSSVMPVPTEGISSSIPTVSSPTSTTESIASPSASSTPQQLQVIINYDIQNQCGLDAEKVTNEDGNTLKTGLIAATTTVIIDTLNATFSREGQRNMRRVKGNDDRDLVYVEVLPHPVNRVYYTDGYPVVIDRILDMEKGCDEGTNCLLIISTVTAVMEPGDDEEAVKKAITDGISQSFKDGSFNSAIPSSTVICPLRGLVKFIPPEPTRLRARKR